MASFHVTGLTDLNELFANIGAASGEMIDEMLEVQADVLAEAEKRTADSMLQGPYNKGAVAGSIRKGKIHSVGGDKYIDILFTGTQHGNRIAEIAYVNEYGKTNQPARPFIATAIEQSEDEAEERAADVIDKYI